jgi:hypothetical protein
MIPVYTLEITRDDSDALRLALVDTNLGRFIEETKVAIRDLASGDADLDAIARRWISRSWMNDPRMVKSALRETGRAIFDLPWDNREGFPMKAVVLKWDCGDKPKGN